MDALLDNGSLAGNFISTQNFNILQKAEENFLSVDGPRLPICSGLDNECVSISAITYNFCGLDTGASPNRTSIPVPIP